MMLFVCIVVKAQRFTDKLDRGLVATVAQNGNGNFVSWRIFGEEYYGVTYNLYCNGSLLASNLSVSNYVHKGGNSSSSYQVAPVYNGKEGQRSEAVARWLGDYQYKVTQLHQVYKDVPFKRVTDRNGTDVTGKYIINDISLADVTGDGVVEFIVKRLNSAVSTTTWVNGSNGEKVYQSEAYCPDNDSTFNLLECYNMKGERLWYIDCGPNLCSRGNTEINVAAFDWDRDGKAEVIMRGADNMIIHTSDGGAINIGDMNVDTRWVGIEYTNSGREFLLYLNGETGQPYPIGPDGSLWMDYPLPRYEVGETDDLLGSSAEGAIWGEGIQGHRPTKHRIGAPFLDGKQASIFIGRGCYTRHKFCALDVDSATHQLTQRWRWNCYDNTSPWYGNGYHNFQISDVDWDGRDEIVYGSMVVDDNGLGLSTTGLGHGDAQHCADLDPYRHGQEQFACNETRPAMNYRDATTSKIYYRLQTNSDDGRALCGNFTNKYPGCVGMSSQSGAVSTVADKLLPDVDRFDLNFRIYWDGDLCEEILNSQGTEKQAKIDKLGVGRIFLSTGDNMCNWTKNTPSAQGDILGDWREEIIMRKGDNMGIRIWTTNYPTRYRIPTLWHDHQYRQAMVWQMCAYNQPPHTSFFLGELEGITNCPPPLMLTGRTMIPNGSVVSKAHNDKQILMYDTGNMEYTLEDGASPHVAIFNVPSWVQGTNSSKTDGTADIIYEYFTCNVRGGAFAGNMRLVKQGDGILHLPKVEQRYTGPTDVWAGTLNFDGKLLNSSLWLNRFAQLNSDGGEFRYIKMDYDSKLRPGGADNVGVITTDSLILGFGSRIIIDLYSNDDLKADQIHTEYLSLETKDWEYGPRYLAPVMEFSVHTVSGEPETGRYLIGTADSVQGCLDDILIEGLGTKHSASLTYEGGKIYIDIANIRTASSIIWNGNNSNVWDFANQQNFTLASNPNVTDESFITGDKVFFLSAASQYNIAIEGAIDADSIIVDSNEDYLFGGNGSIIGSSAIVKRGEGKLTIKNDNAYTGGTRISGGTVSVSALSNANQEKGNLGAVVHAPAKFVIENGATLQATASVTQGSPMLMMTDEGGVINNASDFIVDKPISGTKLTKEGNGLMRLNVDNAELDQMTIKAGTVRCVSCTKPAKMVELAGGTLTENAGTSYTIKVTGSRKSYWNLAERSGYSNKLIGDGTIQIYCPSVVGKGWMATRTPISGNWSAFEGRVIASVNSGETRFTLDNSYGMPNGTLEIPEDIEVQNSGKTYRIGKVAGKGKLGGVCSFANGGGTGANTWIVGDDDNFDMEATVTGSGTNLTKVGAGCITVAGRWDNTGTVRVNEGELRLTKTASLGTGTVSVAEGALLSGITGNTLLTNSKITIDGTLRVGSTPSATIGVIDFGGKDLTMSRNSVLQLCVSQCATKASTGGTNLANIGQFTMNGTIALTLPASNTLEVGDSVILWSAKRFSGTPTLESTLIDEAQGLVWDTSKLSSGILYVKQGPTAVHSIHEVGHDADVQLYHIDGRTIPSTERKKLSPGIYIIRNGKEPKKIVVK